MLCPNLELKMSYQKMRLHLEEVISRLGMAVQPVLPSDTTPGFAYSVGQHAKGLPELIIFGVPPQPAASLLYEMAAHIEAEDAAGRTVGPGTVDLVGCEMPTMLIAVSAAAASPYATQALDRSDGKAKFLQVVWPDPDGLFPWQPGFNERYRLSQVILGTPIEGTAGPRYLH